MKLVIYFFLKKKLYKQEGSLHGLGVMCFLTSCYILLCLVQENIEHDIAKKNLFSFYELKQNFYNFPKLNHILVF